MSNLDEAPIDTRTAVTMLLQFADPSNRDLKEEWWEQVRMAVYELDEEDRIRPLTIRDSRARMEEQCGSEGAAIQAARSYAHDKFEHGLLLGLAFGRAIQHAATWGVHEDQLADAPGLTPSQQLACWLDVKEIVDR